MSKEISGSDSNILSLIARFTGVGLSEEAKELINKLSDKDLELVAEAIIKHDTSNSIAESYIGWAESIKQR